MEAVSLSAFISNPPFPKAPNTHFNKPTKFPIFPTPKTQLPSFNLSKPKTTPKPTSLTHSSPISPINRHWMVIMDNPPRGMPVVLSVKPDPDYSSVEKDYSLLDGQENRQSEGALLFSPGNTRYWLVRMDKPGVGVVTKAQMVDFYAHILTKVLGNLQDAQMCIYHVSWQSNLGFCCVLDEECAKELAGIPGVLFVEPDDNFGSENKNYEGNSTSLLNSSEMNKTETVLVDPRKLFVTGLSFYTSEETLRTAFEGFGDIVEVKVITNKISKRSKGYAFIEYNTEEATSVALNEMNGKIINGRMVVVNYAKHNPRSNRPRYTRGRSR